MAKTTAGQVEWHGKELMQALRDGGNEAMFEGAQIVLEAATARVPIFTGRLKDSGYVSTTDKSSYVAKRWYKKERKPDKPFGAIVAFAAPHSHLVEFGTKNMAAQPYLRPALDQIKAKAGEAITVKLTKSLNQKLKKAK